MGNTRFRERKSLVDDEPVYPIYGTAKDLSTNEPGVFNQVTYSSSRAYTALGDMSTYWCEVTVFEERKMLSLGKLLEVRVVVDTQRGQKPQLNPKRRTAEGFIPSY